MALDPFLRWIVPQNDYLVLAGGDILASFGVNALNSFLSYLSLAKLLADI